MQRVCAVHVAARDLRQGALSVQMTKVAPCAIPHWSTLFSRLPSARFTTSGEGGGESPSHSLTHLVHFTLFPLTSYSTTLHFFPPYTSAHTQPHRNSDDAVNEILPFAFLVSLARLAAAEGKSTLRRLPPVRWESQQTLRGLGEFFPFTLTFIPTTTATASLHIHHHVSRRLTHLRPSHSSEKH